MFELNIAAKYLLPKWRRLSLSLISMIAILVISLVVWLILVFFSVTNGLEKMWIEKLIVITGPARIYPTDQYYKSYYYLVDSISSASDYQSKSIQEKILADNPNPWNEQVDEEIPVTWPLPLLDKNGNHRDLLKELLAVIHSEPSLDGFIYEAAPLTLRLQLDRFLPQEEGKRLYAPFEGQIQQNGFVLSFDTTNGAFKKNLLPVRPQDLDNLFKTAVKNHFQQKLKVTQLETPYYGWMLPKHFYAAAENLIAEPVYSGETLRYYRILNHPENIANPLLVPKNSSIPLVVEGGIPITLNQDGILFTLQGKPFSGPAHLFELNVKRFDTSTSPLWVHERDGFFNLPAHPILGDGILLPKTFQDAGAMIGDRGHFLYEAPSLAATTQVQLPVYVAGFYDPGIMAMSGKFILASSEVASLIRSSISNEPYPESNGIQLKGSDYTQIAPLKKRLEKKLEAAGLLPYFKVESYEDYDFAKGFIQELKSQKNVFLILAGMIIIVACSNIISMLIILVNDKKKEIGILRALGARTLSIGSIFGLIGLSMGFIGSLLGIGLSLITLHYLPSLIVFLSHLQGFDAFQRLFYNNTFPTTLSVEALRFVLLSTTLTSLLAAIIPAIKACIVKPAAMLRSE